MIGNCIRGHGNFTLPDKRRGTHSARNGHRDAQGRHGVQPMVDSFEDLLKFDSLETAESTLVEIHRRFSEYRQQGDSQGMKRCHDLILKGKKRAVMIAQNKKVNAAKRKEKEEIALWFTIWLETPDIFEDWLLLRKASPDFRHHFVEVTGESLP